MEKLLKKALLVGINEYHDENGNDLKGCVLDVTKMEKLLSSHECGQEEAARNFDCKVLAGEKGKPVTRDELLKSLRALFTDSCHEALFYFSGHGSQQDLLSGCLVTSDAKRGQLGVTFEEIMDLIEESTIRTITIILDCCHSGSFASEPQGPNGRMIPTSKIREGVSILSSCFSSETAKESEKGGFFTSIVRDALEGQAADVRGHVTLAGVYAHADNLLSSWQQRPTLKANVFTLTTLRRVKPKVPDTLMRRLTQLFEAPDAAIPLDHRYEKHKCEVKGWRNRRRRDYAREEDLKALRRFWAAGLVETPGKDSLYDAAIRDGICQLTHVGKFYWHMVKKGRI